MQNEAEIPFEFEDFEEFEGEKVQKQKRKSVVMHKIKWTVDEEEEIKTLFKKFFEAKKRPKPKDCLKAIHTSKKNNGVIHNRKKDVLKKKVFRMIDKLK